jgi:hypothetical protein
MLLAHVVSFGWFDATLTRRKENHPYPFRISHEAYIDPSRLPWRNAHDLLRIPLSHPGELPSWRDSAEPLRRLSWLAIWLLLIPVAFTPSYICLLLFICLS